MINSFFSVYDSKAAVFCTPFFSENNHTALRAFRYAANDQTTEIGKYPSDYTLYKIGTFDNLTGEILPVEPVPIALAITLVNQPEVNENVL